MPRRRPRRRIDLRRYWLVSFGVSVSAFGLALTASALAVIYAEASPARAQQGTVAVRSGSESMEAEPKRLSANEPLARTLVPGGPRVLPAPTSLPTGSPLASIGDPASEAEAERLHAFGLLPTATPAPLPRAAPVEQAAPTDSAAEAGLPPVASQPNTAASRGVLRRIYNVNLTFYDCVSQGFCGNMANGRRVYEGAAACSYDLPLGTRFFIYGDPTARIYVCEDRGLLTNTWIDVFWYHPADGWRWQLAVGRYGTIDIIEWGE